MDALATVVAIGLVSFLMFYFAGQLEKEHGVLKFLTIMFALALLIVVPAVITNNETCEHHINSTTTTHNTTTYTYTEKCVTDDSNTTTTFFKLVMWFYRLFITYIILYLGYNSLMALKDSYKERGRK